MITPSITVRDSGVIATLVNLRRMDLRKPLQRFAGYFVSRVGHQIEVSSMARGGAGRGIMWRPAAPYYTRRDGTAVPAWGGVAKVRGQGTVRGRRSKGGGRVTAASKFFGGFEKAPGRMLKRRIDGKRLTIDVSKSPGLQFANVLREFLQFQLPIDRVELEKRLLSYVRGQIAQAKRR